MDTDNHDSVQQLDVVTTVIPVLGRLGEENVQELKVNPRGLVSFRAAWASVQDPVLDKQNQGTMCRESGGKESSVGVDTPLMHSYLIALHVVFWCHALCTEETVTRKSPEVPPKPVQKPTEFHFCPKWLSERERIMFFYT